MFDPSIFFSVLLALVVWQKGPALWSFLGSVCSFVFGAAGRGLSWMFGWRRRKHLARSLKEPWQ